MSLLESIIKKQNKRNQQKAKQVQQAAVVTLRREKVLDGVEGWQEACDSVVGHLMDVTRKGAVTKQQVEDAMKVHLTPAEGGGPVEEETGINLLQYLQQHRAVEVTQRLQGNKTIYSFRYIWEYDAHDFQSLLTILPSVINSNGGSRVGVRFRKLRKLYPTVEEDIYRAIRDGTLLAVEPVKLSNKIDLETTDAERTEPLITAIKEDHRDVILYKNHNDADPTAARLLTSIRSLSKPAKAMWCAPITDDRRQITRAMQENKAYPPFKSSDIATKSRAIDDKKAKRIRGTRAELNEHMKDPDENGLQYDFGKPFSLKDVELRALMLRNVKEGKRKRDVDG